MSKNISDVVDFHLETHLRELQSSIEKDSFQTTIRIDPLVKIELDVICHFLGMTRNGLLNEILEAAAEDMRVRITEKAKDFRISGLTVGEMINQGYALYEYTKSVPNGVNEIISYAENKGGSK